ncbi:class I adenylate-forming enzyme family protein [Bacillus sp. E(2018)]|uniref:class I adenylate-forming enzyme family protein n=1 Tax=Bacillus sp. E(2018) TaxID=2502239 RepID=UPI00148531E5|nr:class I adenylate-forming enzyme family protein [Bacillus sp. E(2018)]
MEDVPYKKTLIQYVIHWANYRPDSIALVDPYRQLSYIELKKEIIYIQHFLLNSGINKGVTVAISSQKSVDLIVFYLALFGLGVNVVPLPEQIDDIKKVRNLIKLTHVNYVLTNTDLLKRGTWNLFQVESFLNMADRTVVNFQEIYARNKSELTVYDENEQVYFNITSGSTGNSKAARVGNKEIIYNAIKVNELFPITYKDCYCCLFSSEMHPHEIFAKSIVSGAKCLLLSNFHIRHFKRYLIKEGITHLLTTPNILQKLLSLVPDTETWQGIKYSLTGGENVPYVLRKEFHEITSKKLITAWGSTETTGIVITLPEEYSLDHRNVLGVPIPGYDIKIIPETSELLITGESCIKSYWNFSGTSPIDETGYYHTSDIVSIDETGVLFYEGRLDSIIKVGAKKLSLIHIENQLLQIKGLSEISVLYNQYKMKTFVFFCLTDKQYLDDVIFKVKELLKQEMNTQGFRLIHLPNLPKLSNGKVDKQKLLVTFE